MRSLAAIILAAGKGTRMKSDKPKVIFNFAGKPMIQRVIDTSLQAECDKIVAVVGYKKDVVMNKIRKSSKISYVEQVEQNGTGHAVMVTEEEFENFDGDVFILCGDVPMLSSKTLQKIRNHHQQSKAACTVLTANMDDPLKYGRIIRDENKNVLKIVEFKDATEKQRRIKEINSGIYCFDAKNLFSALKKITNDNQQNEYYLTDTLEILNSEGKLVSSVLLDDMIEASGINSQEQLAMLEQKLYRNIRKKWLNSGVVLEHPDSIIIEEDVVIQNDVTIHPNSIIRGKTEICKGTEIGANCLVNNSILGKNVTLKGYNVVMDKTISEKTILDFYQKG